MDSPRGSRKSRNQRSPKSPRRKLKTKSLSKRLRKSMGQALETYLETDSTSDGDCNGKSDLQVIISGMVRDLNEKDKAIWQLKDTLAKTNLAVIRLQEMMKDVQARLKTNTVVSEAAPTLVLQSVYGNPVEVQRKEPANLILDDELSASLDNLGSNKPERKKRKNRSPSGRFQDQAQVASDYKG